MAGGNPPWVWAARVYINLIIRFFEGSRYGIRKQKILHINHYFSHRTILLSFSDISDVSAIFLFFFSLTEKNSSVCPHKCGQISILHKKIALPNKKQSNFHI